MTGERDEPLYVISVVARMVGVHAQTLRYYERAGLVAPSRSRGNRRYYSQRDLERLIRIKTLMDDMGMNLAGAEVVIRLMDRIGDLEQDIQNMKIEIQRMRAGESRPALGEGKPSSE